MLHKKVTMMFTSLRRPPGLDADREQGTLEDKTGQLRNNCKVSGGGVGAWGIVKQGANRRSPATITKRA